MGHFWVAFSLNLEVPGSIPGSRGSLLGHFLVGAGSLFRECWNVLGFVLGYFGEVFGWVWEGLEKKFRRGRQNMFFKNAWEYVSHVGVLEISMFSLLPDRK